MINGFEYSYEDISTVFAGKLLTGFTAVKYKVKKDHKNIYGKGAKPVAMGRGKKEYDGSSVTVLQSELEAIQAQLPDGKDLTDLAPFTLTVSYAPEGGKITTDTLLFCRVMDYEKGMKSGDGNMEIELQLMVGDIKYNV